MIGLTLIDSLLHLLLCIWILALSWEKIKGKIKSSLMQIWWKYRVKITTFVQNNANSEKYFHSNRRIVVWFQKSAINIKNLYKFWVWKGPKLRSLHQEYADEPNNHYPSRSIRSNETRNRRTNSKTNSKWKDFTRRATKTMRIRKCSTNELPQNYLWVNLI